MPVTEEAAPVWGEGERPKWLVPEDQVVKKREWSPARDRMEAEMELRARLEEQRQLRRKNRYSWLRAPLIWTTSLVAAVISEGRDEPAVAEPAAGDAPAAPAGGAASLDALPQGRTIPEEMRPEPPAKAERGPAPAPPAAAPVAPEEPVDWTAPPSRPAPTPPPPVEFPEAIRPPEVEPERGSAPEAQPEEGRAELAEEGEARARAAFEDWSAPPEEQPPAAAPPAPEAPPAPGAPPAPKAPTDVEWPDRVQPAPAPRAPRSGPVAPHKDWRPQAGAVPLWEHVPEAARQPVAPPPAPAALPPTELGKVLLATCLRTTGAEVGAIVLLQDDAIVMRASSGLEESVAATLALDTLGELCLDVIASGTPFQASETHAGPADPQRPSAILCVPIPLAGAGVGAVLLASYAPGTAFDDDRQRLVAALAAAAGPVLADAGAYTIPLSDPGTHWRPLNPPIAAPRPAPPPAAATVGPERPAEAGELALESEEAVSPPPAPPELSASPSTTLTLDREVIRRLIQEAAAAREAWAASATPEPAPVEVPAPPAPHPEPEPPPTPQPEPEPAPPPEPAPAPEPPQPADVPEPQPEAAAGEDAGMTQVRQPSEPEPEPAPAPTPAAKRESKTSWRDRVQARMTRVQQQKEEEEARYRNEILAAVRSLSWDGYQALIADIYRRKAFEVYPPPQDGQDLDVIDLVVDRDGQRMLVNCQLRGEMEVPSAAVNEMARVAYNYGTGAYLIADGGFEPGAADVGDQSGVVLIDGGGLIDLVIETTLKDERKRSMRSRIASRFSKKAS